MSNEPAENDKNTSESDETLDQKNPNAVALGRLGGRRGGPARALRLSAERRSEIARQAALARWHVSSHNQEEATNG